MVNQTQTQVFFGMPGWPSVKPNRFRHLKLDAKRQPGQLQERTLMELIESGELDPEDLMEAGGVWCSDAMESQAHVVFGSLGSLSLTTTQKNVS